MRCSILQENLEPIRRIFGSRSRISSVYEVALSSPSIRMIVAAVAFTVGARNSAESRQKGSRFRSKLASPSPRPGLRSYGTRSQMLKIFGVSLRAKASKLEKVQTPRMRTPCLSNPRHWLMAATTVGPTDGGGVHLAASAPERSTTRWRCTSRARKKKLERKKKTREKKKGDEAEA